MHLIFNFTDIISWKCIDACCPPKKLDLFEPLDQLGKGNFIVIFLVIESSSIRLKITRFDLEKISLITDACSERVKILEFSCFICYLIWLVKIVVFLVTNAQRLQIFFEEIRV